MSNATDSLPATFTAADVVAKIREVAAETPDRVYERETGSGKCLYGRDKSGSGDGHRCIVGEALFRLGVTQAHLEVVDGRLAVPGAYQLLTHEFNLPLEAEFELKFADEVQSCQDGGLTWAEAVAMQDAARAG
jgi:hypothetical protein